MLPLDMSIAPWSSNGNVYVLCGGRVDLAEIAGGLEASGVLRKADDTDLTRYTTHLLVASKASVQLERWDVAHAAEVRDKASRAAAILLDLCDHGVYF